MPSLNILFLYETLLAKIFTYLHVQILTREATTTTTKSTSINPTELNQKHYNKKNEKPPPPADSSFFAVFSLHQFIPTLYTRTYLSKCIVHCDVYLFAEKRAGKTRLQLKQSRRRSRKNHLGMECGDNHTVLEQKTQIQSRKNIRNIFYSQTGNVFLCAEGVGFYCVPKKKSCKVGRLCIALHWCIRIHVVCVCVP